MRHAAILRLIRAVARAGTLAFSEHALDEMQNENETFESVTRVVLEAKSLMLQENGRYRLRGGGLVVILQIEDHRVLVSTVYAG